MCDKDVLVSYLYDDLAGPARAAFERHLRVCADCLEELEAMRGVRADLLQWSPPEPDFAFRIVKEPVTAHAMNESRAAQATVLRPAVPSWRAWLTPAAGLAAAAVLVLAAAAGMARIEVHSGPDGWTLRTGWAPSTAATAIAGVGGFRPRDVNLSVAGDEEVWASIERRISALEASSRDTGGFRSAAAMNARTSEETLKVVRELLAQSEKQQKTEMAIRLAQVMRDIDLKRAADLNNVRLGMGKIDANVTEEAATHRALMSYILTNSQQQQQK